MKHEPLNPLIPLGVTRAATMAFALLWLLFPMPERAQAAESLEVQQKVDKELNALELPGPALARLPTPQTIGPPLTGQPYSQQPGAVMNESRNPTTGGGGRGGQPPSDLRLKKDVVLLATLADGIKVYSFKYLWDDVVHVGVMAQDLLADPAHAHAVVSMANGYYAVDYAKLGLRMATLEEWEARGKAALLSRPVAAKAAAVQ